MAAADIETDAPEPMDLQAPGEALEPVPGDTVASSASGKEKKGKAKKAGKGKKAAKGEVAQEGASGEGPTIAAHPRAARAVARAKSWAGLAGFVAGGYLSLPTHTLADAGLRALIAGVVSYVAVWGAAVFLWRRLVVLELKARQHQLIAPPAQSRALPGQRGTRGERSG